VSEKMKVVFIGSGSMGPRFIMGLLKHHGHECYGIFQGINDILGEQPAAGFDPPIKLDHLLALQPDIIGFSACSFDFSKQLEMAAMVRQADNNILIVFGGIHPTIDPESTIRHEQVNIVCIGEGEYPLLGLCEALENHRDIHDIPSLWVKHKDFIYKNPIRDYPQDLDNLPMDREGLNYMGIFTGRGCIGNCSFCNTPTIRRLGVKGRFFRKRSVTNVLDEVEEILAGVKPNYNLKRAQVFVQTLPRSIKRYGQKAISKLATVVGSNAYIREPLKKILGHLSSDPIPPIRFKDDSFLTDKKWFLQFAAAFQERFPEVKYICQARVNEIDEDVAYWLEHSKCKMVSLGIECGNDEFRNKILKKGVTSEQIIHAVNLLHSHDISVLGQWMVGYPGESVELALESLRLHCRLGDIPQVHIAIPFPGTEMHDRAVDMGFIHKDFVPSTSLYDDFLFHTDYKKMLMRLIHDLFPVSRLVIPDDFNDISFLEQSEVYRGGTMIGDIVKRAFPTAEV
jgi:radical SAM superfamily enzyme YgiQ (UPF0313 family)